MTTSVATQISTRTVRNHATAVAFFTARRAELVEAAEVCVEMAATILGYGDRAAAADLMAEARGILAEVAKIDALRK